MKLKEEIMNAINRTSRENKSNTPDFILAEYLMDCLRAYEKASEKKTMWNGGLEDK